MQRWLKFVKYLPDFNIEPHVYIPENPTYPLIDEKLFMFPLKLIEFLEREKINFVSGAKVQKMILTETFCQKSTALSGYYNPGRLHIQYKYHFTKRRVLVLWWTTPTSENVFVPAALQRA